MSHFISVSVAYRRGNSCASPRTWRVARDEVRIISASLFDIKTPACMQNFRVHPLLFLAGEEVPRSVLAHSSMPMSCIQHYVAAPLLPSCACALRRCLSGSRALTAGLLTHTLLLGAVGAGDAGALELQSPGGPGKVHARPGAHGASPT